MKKLSIIIYILFFTIGAAYASDNPVSLDFKTLKLINVPKIESLELIDENPIGPDQYFGGVTYSPGISDCSTGCFSFIEISDKNISNNTYTVNWVKSQLAKENPSVDWDPGNMEAKTVNASTPEKLYTAVKLNLTFYDSNLDLLYCKNIYLAYGNRSLTSYNFWLFSNNNSKNHTISCINLSNHMESKNITYQAIGNDEIQFTQ